MNRFAWLLTLTVALFLSSIATRETGAQFDTPNRAFHSNTQFPLTGRHQTVACESCHIKGVFKGTPTACYDCHWARKQDDKFKTQLGTQCENCHRTISWAAVRWDHGAMTKMPLNGAHRTIGCESCHTNGRFQGTPVSCVGCHQKDYAATTAPNHAAAGFPTTCEACHRPSDVAFSQARFDHNASFPLTGPHATTTCASCHKNSVFKGTSQACASCHIADFTRAQNPNHTAAGFPTTCETCHRPNQPSWRTPGSTGFAHATFPLTGQHTQQTCTSCHKNNVFQGTPRDCVGCHRTVYERSTAPNHIAAGFPTSCESCHRTTDVGWRSGTGAGFNHGQFYPLVGLHQNQACVSCHKNSVYKGTARDCVGCHRTNYERTTAPNHAAAGIPTTCENCHRATDTSWRGGNFNHNQVFALVGRHAATECVSCHKNNVFKGTARDCVGCHRSQYDRTTSPNHAQAGFSTSCESCHRATDSSWSGAGFNHNQVFPLVGQHTTVACAVCHVNGVFKGTARDCVGCHRTLYERTTTPNHAQAGFSTACESCHRATDSSWRGAVFNHNQVFPLAGRHTAAACATCHVNNVYKGTPRDCVGCHRTLYERTTAPPHAAAGFSTACESCHKASDAQWRGVAFNHNQFFALQGAHPSLSCASCHKNNVYKGTARDCVGCHKAKYDATRNPNHVQSGFPTTCESCHRATDTVWTQGRFTHTRFPLTGRHNVACAQCHTTNSPPAFNCLNCHGRSETDSEHRGRAGYRYESAACYSCHPNGRG